MTTSEKLDFKNTLKEISRQIILQRIEAVKNLMDTNQEAANNEQKSSAGDKYETTRALIHLEKDMHARQLSENVKELANLHAIETNLLYDTVVPGAFIQSSEVSFFIASGLGKQLVDEQVILFLSAHAPLAKLLLGKKTGDKFMFKGMLTSISDLF